MLNDLAEAMKALDGKKSCWDSSLHSVQVHYQYFCGYRQVDSLA